MKNETFGAFVDCEILPDNVLFFRHVFVMNNRAQTLKIRLYNVPKHLIDKAQEQINLHHEKNSIFYSEIYRNIYSK